MAHRINFSLNTSPVKSLDSFSALIFNVLLYITSHIFPIFSFRHQQLSKYMAPISTFNNHFLIFTFTFFDVDEVVVVVINLFCLFVLRLF